jgi:hypothetical protein
VQRRQRANSARLASSASSTSSANSTFDTAMASEGTAHQSQVAVVVLEVTFSVL